MCGPVLFGDRFVLGTRCGGLGVRLACLSFRRRVPIVVVVAAVVVVFGGLVG
jgi:hypothetical protein